MPDRGRPGEEPSASGSGNGRDEEASLGMAVEPVLRQHASNVRRTSGRLCYGHARQSGDPGPAAKGTIMINRLAVVAGSIILAGSILLAILIHRPVIYCSYLGGPPPRGCITRDYATATRVEIVIGGLILAALITTGGFVWTRWRSR